MSTDYTADGVLGGGPGAKPIADPRLADVRAGVGAYIGLVVLFATLVIDGFPVGEAALHEFGARLTNFLLLIVALAMMLRRLMKRQATSFNVREMYLLLAVFVAVPVFNLPVALLQSQVGAQAALIDWLKQYLMLCWGVVSFFLWRALLRDLEPRRYCDLMCVAAVLPVLFFYLEFVDATGTVRAILTAIKASRNARPSGLATEPSIYSAWISFVWPLILYSARNSRPALARVSAAGLLAVMMASAYLSNARTVAVVFMIQLIYLAYWALRKRRAWGARLRTLLAVLCAAAVGVVILFARLMTVVDVASNASDIARMGYTVTGINVFLAHPIIGIGVGEFGNFFAQYVPTFALASGEVMEYVTGTAGSRASTFNLFVRFLCEFGAPVGIIFSYLVLRPVLTAARALSRDTALLYASLSAVGGIGFWLSQDQYGYQPGIVALAVVSLWIERSALKHQAA
jgi:hypothetical protein